MIESLRAPSGHYIAGKWIDNNEAEFYSLNPADGSIVWKGSPASANEVAQAVTAAHEALQSWATQDISLRMEYLQKFAHIVEQNRQKLAHIISLEVGKPLWESATEVSAVIGKINISIQAHQERTAEKNTTTTDALACLRYKPHGVVAVLGAFNFPAHLSNGHIVPALLAGNTVIYKPSELTPAVAGFIMQCWHETGIPQGVINCIQGDASTGQLLLSADIQGVYFTGSYQTGKRIHQHFSDKPHIILALEMGGNNPLIIDEVNDINAAIYHTILSTLITAGQRCTCARRIFIKNNAHGAELTSKLIEAFKRVSVAAFTASPEPFLVRSSVIRKPSNTLRPSKC